MPIANVSIDDAVAASLMNQIIDRLNILDAASTRTIIIGPASGVYSIPDGVTKLRVTIAGGGAGGGAGAMGGADEVIPGGAGGSAPMGNVLLTGLSPGASISYAVGTNGVGNMNAYGTNGTNSNFGPYISSSGGAGGAPGGAAGGNGSLSGADVGVGNSSFCDPGSLRGYGSGGSGGTSLGAGSAGQSGMPGILVIEY